MYFKVLEYLCLHGRKMGVWYPPKMIPTLLCLPSKYEKADQQSPYQTKMLWVFPSWISFAIFQVPSCWSGCLPWFDNANCIIPRRDYWKVFCEKRVLEILKIKSELLQILAKCFKNTCEWGFFCKVVGLQPANLLKMNCITSLFKDFS